MVLPALAAFVVSVSFISLEGIEIPYYVVLFGAGVLKLSYARCGLPAVTREITEVAAAENEQYGLLTDDSDPIEADADSLSPLA